MTNQTSNPLNVFHPFNNVGHFLPSDALDVLHPTFGWQMYKPCNSCVFTTNLCMNHLGKQRGCDEHNTNTSHVVLFHQVESYNHNEGTPK